jgi:hypothetical protein
MGNSDESDKKSICDEDDERDQTPLVTGPVIELRGREVSFAICVFFLTAIVVSLIIVLASNKVNSARARGYHLFLIHVVRPATEGRLLPIMQAAGHGRIGLYCRTLLRRPVSWACLMPRSLIITSLTAC